MCKHASFRPIASPGASSAQQFCGLVVNEPFRALFPLGMILGIIGILLWPLYYSGITASYPLAAHLRLMIQGFLGCFVFGFLFTAGPRLLSCPKPSKPIVAGFFATSIFAALLSFVYPTGSDIVFLIQIITVIGLGVFGFAKRGDLPPPGFVLGVTGLLCALIGAVNMLLLSLGEGGAVSYQLSRILLFQAFPALPLIGIGAFFFPKLSGAPNPQDLPTNPNLSKPWLIRAAFAAATALGFILSIVLEIEGQHKFAYLLRAASLGAYLVAETPLLTRPRQGNTQLLHLLICSVSIVLSFALIGLFPAQKTAWLHGFFICGLSGSIILVATRVVFGHSGNFQLAVSSRKPLLWAIAILTLAAAARVGADFWPDLRVSHYLYAAAGWLLVGLIWLIKVAPKVKMSDAPPPLSPLAPHHPRTGSQRLRNST